MQGDPAMIRTLNPYSQSVLSIRTLSVLYPYSTLHAESAEIRSVIWSVEREYGRRGQSTDAGGGSTERVRSQYGLTSSAASAAYVKHEITFKIGLRIEADRGRNPHIQYGSLADRGGYSIRRNPQHPCLRVKRGIMLLLDSAAAGN